MGTSASGIFESIGGVGTRHRASYRFCAAVPDAVATVISQDGGIQFVAQSRGEVVRWEHSAAGSRCEQVLAGGAERGWRWMNASLRAARSRE